MSTVAGPVAALVAVLVSGAVTATVVGVRPRRRSFAEVRSLLFADPRAPLTSAHASGAADVTWPRISGRLVNGPLGERIRERLGSGLALLDRRPIDIVSDLVVGSSAATFVVALALATLIGTGTVSASPLGAFVVLAVPVACAVVLWSDVAGRVERRRRELQRAVNDLVQLTAVGLTTDQSVEAAVGFALSVGSGEMFELLRRDIEAAPARGLPLWEALDWLGQRFDQRHLSELASSLERQGTHGVSIGDTVSTLAATMRAAALDELERDADRANANLAGPTVGFVVTMLVFLGYPLAIRIGAAFGG